MPNLVGIGNSQVPTNAMLGGLAYQDPAHANLTSVEIENIAAIKAKAAINGTHTFVYDTSKDSDAGLWRKRTNNRTWYNEELCTTTRGSRREFPSIAVIVSENYKIVIYDADDPTLPMWMVINRGGDTNPTSMWDGNNSNSCTSLYALNGILLWGTSSAGAYGADFAGDRSIYLYSSAGTSGYRSQGEIINRNKAVMSRNVIVDKRTTNFIPSNVVYDVSMQVLPNAPVDPATGLEKPTIAIGGNKGVSILQRTGPDPEDDIFYTVIPDQNDSYRHSQFVAFRDDNKVTYMTDSSKRLCKTIDVPNLTANKTNAHWYRTSGDGITIESSYFHAYSAKHSYYRPWYGYITTLNQDASGAYDIDQVIPMKGKQVACRDETKGITLAYESKKEDGTGHYNASIGAYITQYYNTGWFPSRSVFIMANNSDDGATTSLSGSDLITNGTFGSNVTGWTDGSGSGSSISHSSSNGLVGGSMYLDGNTAYAYGSQGFTTVVGKQYAFNVWWQNFSGSRAGEVFIGTAHKGTQQLRAGTGTATGVPGIMVHGTFKATATTHYLTCYTGWQLYVDQIRVTECVPDRSSQQNSLMTNGTVARTPTVTGSKVVAYGPFTESNYLYMRPNRSFKFEEGDFCIGFWFYPTNNNDHQTLVSMQDREFDISLLANQYNQKVRIYSRNSDGTLRAPDAAYAYAVNEWQHIVVNFTGGNTKTVYINGEHDITMTGDDGEYDIDQVDTDASGTGTGLYVGARLSGGSLQHAASHTKIALLKIAASNVSADSVRKWYEDEKMMINNPGECTLYGTNAVNHLAYDSSTDTLHAATASGRSDFRGLVRINNTTTNTTRVSAAGGVISEIG